MKKPVGRKFKSCRPHHPPLAFPVNHATLAQVIYENKNCFQNPQEEVVHSNRTQLQQKTNMSKRKVNEGMFMCIAGFAGQRARVPPDPIPNSEVKPRSVPNCSVVFGHVKLGKLAAYFNP
jgi:hypothetical protein